MSEEGATGTKQNTSTTEQTIKAIWQEVLELPDLPNDISFLDLGGDSLSAMVCIARIRTLWRVEFTIEEFFMESSAITDFSRMINETLSANTPFRTQVNPAVA